MNRLLAATSALAALAAPALAQDTFDLGEITIFTNKGGEETELSRTGATVEVVTEEELRTAPTTKVADFLRTLPGVTASSNGPVGAQSTLRIRGLDGRYIKVMIDGIDVTDPAITQTTFNWGELTTDGISRIEILKGSSSSVYGSRAIGGVVNITTKRATEPGNHAEVMAEGGSFDTFRGGATLTTRGDRGGAAFSINRITTNGFSASAAGTEPDGFNATQYNFSADVAVGDSLELGLSALYLDAEGDFDEFGGDGLPPFDEYGTTRTTGVRAYAELMTGEVQHTFSASYYNNDRKSTSNGVNTLFDSERRRADYQGVWSPSSTATYTFGTDYEEESYNSGADTGAADLFGIFGEALIAPTDQLDLAMSLRWDNHSEFGGHLSGRLAAAYRVTDATILRAVAATGFRAPSLYELNSTLYGNTALQPETSTSFELGAEHQFGGGNYVKATAFYTRITDLIQFVTLTPWPAFTGQYQQVPGTSVSKGIELSGQWVINDIVSLVGSYTYTDATDATGAPLLRVPGNDLVIGLDAQLTDQWSGKLFVNYVADRPAEFGTPMPDYTVVDAALSYAVNDRAEFYLRIENLFDEQYQTAAGYNAPSRGFYFGFRGTF